MTAGPEAATDFGSPLFAELREAAGEDWTGYVEHPFVTGLGEGSLPREAFLHYLKQDYVFLVHFARAWSLLAFKSTDIEEMRLCAATVHALIGEEMRLHVQSCAREGIDEGSLAATRERAETVAYTRFVIDRGLAGDGLDLLVALAPCVFGYGEIGARLAHGHGTAGPYGAWINTYSGADYQGVCRSVGDLMERMAARLIGPEPRSTPRWPALAETFRTACRLEQDFWRMGLNP